MARVRDVRGKAGSRPQQAASSHFPSCSRKICKSHQPKNKYVKASEKKDWENATCAVCLESPHNAVLLLCSSYNKGCRAYMCATGRRFSNCLAQYKKAYTKVILADGRPQGNGSVDNAAISLHAECGTDKAEVPELLCPLCRGQVKGWTVVEPARKYLNAKKRTCMQDKCSFTGNYKRLRKHVRAKHPLARPRAVDPVLEEKWKKLEGERERNDVISTIMSSTPGAMVLGDYVIEPGGHHGIYDYDSDDFLDDDDDDLYPLESFDRGMNELRYRTGFSHYNLFDRDDFGMRRSAPGSTASSRGFRGILLGNARRRWRYRAAGNRAGPL